MVVPEDILGAAAECEGIFELIIIKRVGNGDVLIEEIVERELLGRLSVDAKIRIVQTVLGEKHEDLDAKGLADDLRTVFEFRNKIAHSITTQIEDMPPNPLLRIMYRRGRTVTHRFSQEEVDQMVRLAEACIEKLTLAFARQTLRLFESSLTNPDSDA